MGVRIPVTVLLLLGVLCTTTTAFMMGRRDSGTACEKLRSVGMAAYNDGKFILEETGVMNAENWPKDAYTSSVLCQIADARTLEDVTDAIDPNLPPYIRDGIQLYYIIGTSVIEFLGGVDGIRIRVNFLRAWADFARDNSLDEGPASYDVAFEFTSGLVDTYGEDFLKTLGKGMVFVAGGPYYGPLLGENDVIQPEKLARALSGEYDSSTEIWEVAGLSRPTCESMGQLIDFVTVPGSEQFYPKLTRFADRALVFLETLDDMQLLDLELAA